ncbi:MAG TPA: TraB/GumN family protein [Oligoflexus sp.]|uniref:TraB/GumN family protein n=1 Tax=Oligoflexus sp. TaxID=1971216 RepID=UPI002D800B80|nr:TraB/GumN family protein [Oligoflexus sp.]HET9240182.1 TraB/GumN family protein [Oligoflexus sp.]
MYQAGRWRSLLSVLFLSTWALLHWSSCVTPTRESGRQGLIWEATRGTQLVTLVGTMHIGVSPNEIPKGLWTRLEAADTVVTEVDLTGMNGTIIRRYLVLPEKTDLKTQLGPQDWAKFKGIVQEAFPQMMEAQLLRMTPLAACSNLMLAEAQLAQKASEDPAERGRNVRGEVSMDQYIVEKAREQKKNLKTFESLEEQFNYLDKVFTLEQLREMLAESEENRQYYTQLAKSFKDGDSETIDGMVAMMPDHLREALLDQRNDNWGRKMPAILSSGNTFIAVGAAHLGGKNGLLNILEAQGFTLRPLKL